MEKKIDEFFISRENKDIGEYQFFNHEYYNIDEHLNLKNEDLVSPEDSVSTGINNNENKPNKRKDKLNPRHLTTTLSSIGAATIGVVGIAAVASSPISVELVSCEIGSDIFTYDLNIENMNDDSIYYLLLSYEEEQQKILATEGHNIGSFTSLEEDSNYVFSLISYSSLLDLNEYEVLYSFSFTTLVAEPVAVELVEYYVGTNEFVYDIFLSSNNDNDYLLVIDDGEQQRSRYLNKGDNAGSFENLYDDTDYTIKVISLPDNEIIFAYSFKTLPYVEIEPPVVELVEYYVGTNEFIYNIHLSSSSSDQGYLLIIDDGENQREVNLNEGDNAGSFDDLFDNTDYSIRVISLPDNEIIFTYSFTTLQHIDIEPPVVELVEYNIGTNDFAYQISFSSDDGQDYLLMIDDGNNKQSVSISQGDNIGVFENLSDHTQYVLSVVCVSNDEVVYTYTFTTLEDIALIELDLMENVFVKRKIDPSYTQSEALYFLYDVDFLLAEVENKNQYKIETTNLEDNIEAFGRDDVLIEDLHIPENGYIDFRVVQIDGLGNELSYPKEITIYPNDGGVDCSVSLSSGDEVVYTQADNGLVNMYAVTNYDSELTDADSYTYVELSDNYGGVRKMATNKKYTLFENLNPNYQYTYAYTGCSYYEGAYYYDDGLSFVDQPFSFSQDVVVYEEVGRVSESSPLQILINHYGYLLTSENVEVIIQYDDLSQQRETVTPSLQSSGYFVEVDEKTITKITLNGRFVCNNRTSSILTNILQANNEQLIGEELTTLYWSLI